MESSGIFKVIYGLLLAPLMGLFLGFLVYYPIYKYAVTAPNQNSWICRVIYSLCVFVIFMAITFFFVVLQAVPPSGFSCVTYGLLIGSVVGLIFAIAFVLLHKKLLSMTGEFRFSLSFLQNALNRIRVNHNVEPTMEEYNQGEFGSATVDSSRDNDEPEERTNHISNEIVNSNSPNSGKKLSYENHYATNIDEEETGVASQNTTSTPIGNGYGALETHATEDNDSGSKLFNRHQSLLGESAEVKRVFQPLQLLCACYAAINHGSNDVANCIGPLVTAWMIYKVCKPTYESFQGNI